MKQSTARNRAPTSTQTPPEIDEVRLLAAIDKMVGRRITNTTCRQDLIAEVTRQVLVRAKNCPAGTDLTDYLIWQLPSSVMDAWRVLDRYPRGGRKVLAAQAQAELNPGEGSLLERTLQVLRGWGWTEQRVSWAWTFLEHATSLEEVCFDPAVHTGPGVVTEPEAFALAKLNAFVDRLPPKDAELFALLAQNLDATEIAARLKVSSATISLRKRALKAKFVKEVM